MSNQNMDSKDPLDTARVVIILKATHLDLRKIFRSMAALALLTLVGGPPPLTAVLTKVTLMSKNRNISKRCQM
jgi:hypothetical protein